MMMLKLNSTLCDNSFIESYSMRVSAAGGSEQATLKDQLATARGTDNRLNGRDYSMGFSAASGSFKVARSLPLAVLIICAASSASLARRLPRGNWRDREGVEVAPEQLDEARFADFDLAAREDARPPWRGRSGQFIAGARLHRRAVVGVQRVDFVSEAEMLARLRRAVRLPVNETQTVLGHVEMRVEPDGFLQMLHGLLRAALLQISAPDQIMHFGRGVEFEGAPQMRQRFVELAFAREEAPEPVMGGERLGVERESALQVDLGRLRLAIVAA